MLCWVEHEKSFKTSDLVLLHTHNKIKQKHVFQVPPEISSTGPYLLVRFRSDDTINWKGFSAVYMEGGRAFPPVGNANTLTLPFP